MTCVGTADDERRLERGEACGEDVGSAVKGVFRTGVKVEVPYLEEARRVLGSGSVLGVGG